MKHKKYLETLKTFDDFVTITEWANQFVEMYPDEIKELKEDEKVLIRNIVKSITSLVSTGKWSNIILIDKNTKPQKIKFIADENQENDIDNNIHLVKSPKIVKTINFKELMKAIEFLPDDYDLPHRDEYTHFENNAQCVGHKVYIAFEMAIRNKGVIDISEKLDYLDEIIEKNSRSNDFKDWLRGIEYWEDMFEGESPELSIDSKQKKEYIFVAELPITKFKQEIDFLTNEKEFINEKPESVIHLKIIADYLQNKLIREYHIYEEGYYFIKDSEEFDPDDVIDSDSIYKHDFNTHDLEDDTKLVIDKLLNRKESNMKQTADMFFIYDYFNKREENDSLDLCALDLKCELTKYHGVKIEGYKEKISYDECLERYEEFKNLKASFFDVEKTINKKIDNMVNFIKQKQYRFILFY